MIGNGIGEAAGSGVPIEFNGETLILEPLELQDMGVIENHLLSKQNDILAEVAKTLHFFSEEERSIRWKEALEVARQQKRIPPQEVLEYIQSSLEGVALTFHLMLNKRYPGRFPIKECYKILEELYEKSPKEFDELKRRRDQVSGLSPEGNSSSPASGAPTRNPKPKTKPKTKRRKTSTGTTSSGN